MGLGSFWQIAVLLVCCLFLMVRFILGSGRVVEFSSKQLSFLLQKPDESGDQCQVPICKRCFLGSFAGNKHHVCTLISAMFRCGLCGARANE